MGRYQEIPGKILEKLLKEISSGISNGNSGEIFEKIPQENLRANPENLRGGIPE